MLLFLAKRNKFHGSFTFVTEKRNNMSGKLSEPHQATGETQALIDQVRSDVWHFHRIVESIHVILNSFCKGPTFEDTHCRGKNR